MEASVAAVWLRAVIAAALWLVAVGAALLPVAVAAVSLLAAAVVASREVPSTPTPTTVAAHTAPTLPRLTVAVGVADLWPEATAVEASSPVGTGALRVVSVAVAPRVAAVGGDPVISRTPLQTSGHHTQFLTILSLMEGGHRKYIQELN